MHEYVKKILTARVYDVAIESPLDPMPRLRSGLATRYLKREDLQPVFSFKLRGAYNKMSRGARGSWSAASSAPRPATMPRASPWPRRA